MEGSVSEQEASQAGSSGRRMAAIQETKWSGMLWSRHVGQHPMVAVSDCNLAAAHSKTLSRAFHDARMHNRTCVAIHGRRALA